MKAVIALSGLAGFLLLGTPFLRSQHAPHAPPDLPVDVQARIARIESRVIEHAVQASQSPCRFEAERRVALPARAGQGLRLSAGSGSLEVVGVAGLGEVRAVARACASHEDYLEELQLTARESAGAIEVEALYPDFSGFSLGGNRYARLDLRLEVPEGMAAEISDGSGEAILTGLGSLDLEDGSGEVLIERMAGDVRVRDGSGELEITGVGGSLRIEDGSGEIIVRDVAGDVEVEDSSGEAEITGVGGSVTLSDSSGEIDVREVQRDVRVLGDGSGSIRVDGVQGDLTVERDGSGSISHRNVAGTVDIPRKIRRR